MAKPIIGQLAYRKVNFNIAVTAFAWYLHELYTSDFGRMGRLFKEFEQLNSGISRKYGGTGLGLAIINKLVELHRGKIMAESKYGEGSTFTFLIPLKAYP